MAASSWADRSPSHLRRRPAPGFPGSPRSRRGDREGRAWNPRGRSRYPSLRSWMRTVARAFGRPSEVRGGRGRSGIPPSSEHARNLLERACVPRGLETLPVLGGSTSSGLTGRLGKWLSPSRLAGSDVVFWRVGAGGFSEWIRGACGGCQDRLRCGSRRGKIRGAGGESARVFGLMGVGGRVVKRKQIRPLTSPD